MDESAKKGFIYLLVAVGIFIIFKPRKKEDTNNSTPLKKSVNSSGRIKLVLPTGSNVTVYDNLQVDNAMVCVKAFISAYNNDENEGLLTDLNNEMKDNYGLYLIKKSNDITVYNLDNKEVLVAKI
jgi:hypothetical protein